MHTVKLREGSYHNSQKGGFTTVTAKDGQEPMVMNSVGIHTCRDTNVSFYVGAKTRTERPAAAGNPPSAELKDAIKEMTDVVETIFAVKARIVEAAIMLKMLWMFNVMPMTIDLSNFITHAGTEATDALKAGMANE